MFTPKLCRAQAELLLLGGAVCAHLIAAVPGNPGFHTVTFQGSTGYALYLVAQVPRKQDIGGDGRDVNVNSSNYVSTLADAWQVCVGSRC